MCREAAVHGPDSACGKEREQVRAIAFFGYDSSESTLRKRVKAFQSNGSRVIGFMFRRIRAAAVTPPTWENIDLGVTIDRNYLRRIPKLLGAVFALRKHRPLLRDCRIYYARNIDMLLVAVMAAKLFGRRPVIAYEVLDVQRIFLGNSLKNAFARWVERVLLRSCDLLVVSAPDFIAHYYLPYQHLSVPWWLLENKVPAGQSGTEAAASRKPKDAGRPWVIGWFGTLRCVKSLEILTGLAEALGEGVRIILRGRTSEEDLPMTMIKAAEARHPNVIFGGSYASPADLAEIYGGVHFSWSVDYLDAGTNSDWLLPNRIYEGGLFGVPALARKACATGRKVEADGLGWTFDEPLAGQVLQFFQALDADTYEAKRSAVSQLRRSLFVDETDTRDLLAYLDARCRERFAEDRGSSRPRQEMAAE